jgi:class 3 adenylate cyclase
MRGAMSAVSVTNPEDGEVLQRKLTAIMFTDMFGYSQLMSRDERKAIALLSDHDGITDRVISSFRGRILKRMGDAVFAEFGSSVDALNCGIKIQEALKEYNREKGIHERILVRIGLHEGDVIVRGDDLFGEGVNVAARLEPLADPGGICISEALYQSVRNSTNVEAVKVGDVELKNILQRYTIYKIPSLYAADIPPQPQRLSRPALGQGYRIKKIVHLPVKYLSPIELALASVVVCALCLVAISYIALGSLEVEHLLGFAATNALPLAGLTGLLSLAAIYFYSMKSVRIVFDDIRAVDTLLDSLASQIGYSRHLKEANTILLKPSLYHFIMYSARKITAVFDGNAVVLSGNYMYIRKLMRVIRSFESVS